MYEFILLKAEDDARLKSFFFAAALYADGEVIMLRTLSLLMVVLWAVGSAAPQAMPEEILPAGMLLQCSLEEPNFSSRTAEIGDPVLCYLGRAAAFGHSVVPRGASLAGRFQDYRDPGHFFGKGWIDLVFDRLVLPGGVTVPVSAKVISVPRYRVSRDGKIHGRGHPKRDAVGWAIPVLWPVKILTLPARGPRPTLKGEVRITLRFLEDVEIPTISSTATSLEPQNPGLKPSNRITPSQHLDSGSSRPSLASAAERTKPAQDRPKPVRSSYFPFEDTSVPQLTWLILKDGTSYLVRDYWFEFGKMQYITLDGKQKLLPVRQLDLDKTIRLNQERNVAFVIRGKER